MKQHFRYEKGFTMIELVIVIAILGILAATALPKFTNLVGGSNGARAATVQAQARAFLAGVVNVQAQWAASGSATSGTFTFNSTTITIGGSTAGQAVTTSGFPIVDTVTTAATTSALWGLIMQGGTSLPNNWTTRSGGAGSISSVSWPASHSAFATAGQQIFYPTSVASNTNCGFIYSNADGSVTVSVSGC